MWSIVVFLLFARFPCVFLSLGDAGVAWVFALVKLGWFACEKCVWGVGGWESWVRKLGVVLVLCGVVVLVVVP